MFQITSVDSLLIQLIVFFVINTIFGKLLNGTIILGSSSFWFGWFCLLLGAKSFTEDGLMDALGFLELKYISIFHQGAFFGFLFGSFLLLFSKKKTRLDTNNQNKLQKVVDFLLEKVSNKILYALFFVGLVFLIQRIATVGLNLSFFTNARAVYNERGFNFFSWLGNHLSVLVSVFIVIQGIKDGYTQMNIKRLFRIILFASPLFLANATRTFLIFPLINYFASFLLTRSSLSIKKGLLNRREIINFSSLLGLMLLIFSLIGFIRGGYGEDFNIVYTILSWPVSTAYALDSWLYAATVSQGTNGLLTFDWFANFLERIGLLDFSEEKLILQQVNQGFVLSNDSASVIPRSMIPDLIFDFGKRNVFITIFFIASISQIIIQKLKNQSIFKHQIATGFLISMFMTIQNNIFSPGFVIAIFWSLIIGFYAKQKLKAS